MAVRTFCDRCGHEILDVAFVVRAGTIQADLCSECKQQFIEFMKSPVPSQV